LKISSLLKITGSVFLILSFLNIISVYNLKKNTAEEQLATQRKIEFKQLGYDLAFASDYLTNEARIYVQFGDKAHYDNYWKEVNETKTRDHVVEQLKALNAPQAELDLIEKAKNNSDVLIQTEDAAMKAVERKDFDSARKLMFDSNYDSNKQLIKAPLDEFQQQMNARAELEALTAKQRASTSLTYTIILLIITFLALFVIFILIYYKLRPLKIVNEKIAELAGNGGDLTARLSLHTKDEIGEISLSLNKMLDSLQRMITDISNTSKQVLQASAILSSNAHETSNTTIEISNRVKGVEQGATASFQSTLDGSRAIEEMAQGIQRVAESSNELSLSAVSTDEDAVKGFNFMEQAKSQMSKISDSVHSSVVIVSKLEERSSHIEKIVHTITDISTQTNLLSLNASIEAARAGEHGAGFAVVAGEIRKLANNSAISAGLISDLLKEIKVDSVNTVKVMHDVTQEVQIGNEKVQNASDSFQKILNSTKAVASQIIEVSAITEQMAAGSEEIAASVSEMTKIAEESLESIRIVNDKTTVQSNLVQQVGSLSESLSQDAQNLDLLISKFII
jgi:methyl-accepting chemotaxis protein